MLKTVILSDGLPCKVQQLGLFQLDNVGREVLGVYRYSLLLATGQIVTDEYDIRALTYTPTLPDKPANEIAPNSPEWYQLQDYETYRAALAHEKLRIASYEDYVNDIAAYILASCISSEDKDRIVTVEDWDAVQLAALVSVLTEEGIAQTLRETFQSYIQEYGNLGRAAESGE